MFSEPTLEQLEEWATPRLLRFYKIKRNMMMKNVPAYDEEPNHWYEFYSEYVPKVKEILNKREHVS